MKRRWITCFIALFLQLTAFASSPLVQQGNTAYEKGYYDLAISNYLSEAIARQPSAALLHNLGLAYSQAGFHGKALFCFTKALELNPRNARIKASYRAETATAGASTFKPYSPALWFSASDLFWMNAVIAMAAFALVLMRLFQKKAILTISTLILLALWILIIAIQLPQIMPGTNRSICIVAVPETQIRNGPFSEASVLKQIKDGQILKILERHEDWLQIEDSQNSVGWVRSDHLLEVSGTDGLTMLTTRKL
ncbi:MAG: repeat-containing protein [Verrucomicrobiales bacterium]|nr:repeat-containing protein [Verrucomicrobiales bacterium]